VICILFWHVAGQYDDEIFLAAMLFQTISTCLWDWVSRVYRGTCERLNHAGYKGQTYDDVINYLLDLSNKKQMDLKKSWKIRR
jgi:hypothetical protein